MADRYACQTWGISGEVIPEKQSWKLLNGIGKWLKTKWIFARNETNNSLSFYNGTGETTFCIENSCSTQRILPKKEFKYQYKYNDHRSHCPSDTHSYIYLIMSIPSIHNTRIPLVFLYYVMYVHVFCTVFKILYVFCISL